MHRHRDLAVLLACLLFSSNASAAVLCARLQPSTGTFQEGASIKLRATTCRSREVQLDPDTLGIRGPKGDPGTPGVRGPGAVVRDATGALVGIHEPVLIGTFGAELLVRSFAGVTATFGFDKNAIDGTVNAVFYESTDCSGAPLVKDQGAHFGFSAAATLLAPFGAAIGDGLLYYPTGASFITTIKSWLTSAGCVSAAGSERVFAATVEDASSLVPPFRLSIE